MFTITVFFYIKVCFNDPGILDVNNNKYTQEEIYYIANSKPKLKYNIVDKGEYNKYKICYTCLIVRPLNASHCKTCNCCIVEYDHHCNWISSCIGKNNYVYFYYFLLFLSIWFLCVLIVNIELLLEELTNSEAINKERLVDSRTIIIIISSIYCFLILVIGYFILRLFIFHSYLMTINSSTKKYINKTKTKASKPLRCSRLFLLFKEKLSYFYPNEIFKTYTNTEERLVSTAIKENHGSLSKNKVDIPNNVNSNIEKINKSDIIKATDTTTIENLNKIISNMKYKTERTKDNIIYSLINNTENSINN